MSLSALSVGGELSQHQLLYGASLIPALVVGFGLAVPLQRRMHGKRVRNAVLVLAGLSSIVAIVRAAF